MLKRYIKLYRAMSRYRRVSHDRREITRNVVFTLGFMLLVEVMLLFQAYPLKLYIDNGLESKDIGRWTLIVGSAVLMAHVLEEVFGRFADRYRFRALWGNYALINVLGTQHLLALGRSYHLETSSGEKDSILARNHKKVDELTDQICFNVLPMIYRIGAILIFSFVADWRAGLLAIFSVVSFTATMFYSQSLSRSLHEKYRAHMKRLEISEAELSHHAITIDEQGLTKEFAEAHATDMDDLVAKERVNVPKWRNHVGYQHIVLAIVRAGYYPMALFAYRAGTSIGTLILLSGILERMWSNLHRFQELQRVKREGLPALEELTTLFETKVRVPVPDRPAIIKEPHGRIVFSDVSYRYGDQSKLALQDINLTIEPGEMVALVGQSGSGKSTMAMLTMRLADPEVGKICFDDVDLRDLDPQYLRQSLIGYVSQDNVLFDRTITENIRLGCIDASEQAVREAATMAAIDGFIDDLPNGYDTMVGERGVRLSGGQRQRLALARALIKKPPLLVLDEPTSALDAESQDMVKDTLAKLAVEHSMTVLIIAHRLSTIESADRIVTLQSGQIEFVGTTEEHEAQNGIYADLKRREGM
jgi:ABC-type multidrug transport system fused ATPase/permease subunit